MEKFSRKNWTLLLLFGAVGQLAWSVENMFFSDFVYNEISSSAAAMDAITLMVQLSGIVATVATLVAGALSDKLGNRKSFISIGYIIWGITVGLFGCLTPNTIESVMHLPKEVAISFALTMAIVVDCVMTLFGSTANDAAFNAWVTDNTKPSFRGSVESVLAILPLVALLVVVGGFGALKAALGSYQLIFIGLGLVTSVCGVLGLLFFEDAPDIKKSGGFRDIFYGFRPSVIKQNLPFYTTLLSVAVFGIAIQVFMSFIIMFMEHYLLFGVMEYSIVFAVAILAGAAVNIYLGKLSDRMEKSKLLYAAATILSVGLLIMYLASFIDKSNLYLLMVVFGIGGFTMICGNIFSSALNGSILRDYTPEGTAGRMQGVRMVAGVLIPMVVGPAIGNGINKARNIVVEVEVDGIITSQLVPAPEIFLAGAVITLLAFAVIPLIRKVEKK